MGITGLTWEALGIPKPGLLGNAWMEEGASHLLCPVPGLDLIKIERVTIRKKGKSSRAAGQVLLFCWSLGAADVFSTAPRLRAALGAWGGYRSLRAVPSRRGELVPARKHGMVGLAAKTLLGFTPPLPFSCKHPGLVHRQLEAGRRGWGCVCRRL